MIDDGRALTFAAIAGLLGIEVVRSGLALEDRSSPDPELIDLAHRIGKPITSKGLVYHPDGLVTQEG